MIILNNKGILPDIKRTAALDRAVEIISAGDAVKIPLYKEGEIPLYPVCSVGKKLYRNSVLAVSSDGEHGVTCPVSGVFMGVSTMVHPLCGGLYCADVSVNQNLPDAPTECFDRLHVTSDDIISIAKGAFITDEFDGIPLYQKLCAFKESGVQLLAGNAVDDIPYCSSAVKTVCEYGADVAAGLELCMRATGAQRGTIFVYDCGGKSMRRIKDKYSIIDVERVNGKYPVMPYLERRLERKYTFGTIGVGALRALFNAVCEGEPVRTVMVTVAGDGVKNPANCLVTIGTPILQVLKSCGLKSDTRYVILGGAFNGACCESEEELLSPVYPEVRCITALTRREVQSSKSRCIGCGRCIEVCPVGLMPNYIARCVEQGKPDEALLLKPEMCIGCGACGAVCPAGRELYSVISLLKAGEKSGLDLYDWGDMGDEA